jgi:hypothetical protein
VITYNGAPLTQVPGTANNKNKGIWYLDNPYTGGAADLVIDMTSYSVVNGIGFGVVSVSGAAPGTTGGNAAGGLEVSITTTVPGSLIVSGYASNSGGIPTVPTGHSELYTSGDIGSADGAAAYLNLVAAGSQTVTYGQTGTLADNSTSAAGFAPALVIVSTNPTDNATDAPLGGDLVATFSETVSAATGDIELWQVGGGSPVETFNVASEFAFSGQTLTVNPTSDLVVGVEYFVLIPSTAVVDLSSQAFVGLAGTEAWNFGTVGQTWDGGGADNLWTSVLNWDADLAPDFAQPITFQGSTRTTSQNDRTAGSTVAGIHFTNDGTTFTNAFTLQGIDATTSNSMTLGGDITTTARASGSMEDQIHASLDVILDSDRTITTNLNHNFRFVGGVYETGGSRKFIKEGVGVLTLSSASLTTVNNSFSGGIDINNGSVQLLKTAAAGTGTINLGATSGSANAELRLAEAAPIPPMT